jgi:hypothetical protein
MPTGRPPWRPFLLSGVNVNPDALLTGAQAARLVGVSKQLVRRWRQLGHLEPVAEHPPRYRVRDVWKAERATRRSPHSHRAA